MLPNIDLTKLSRLQERLVKPSTFSTQYLFPGNQVFFRDFIVASENHATFNEQLKLALIAELMEINNSSFSIMNVAAENDALDEYIVSFKFHYVAFQLAFIILNF